MSAATNSDSGPLRELTSAEIEAMYEKLYNRIRNTPPIALGRRPNKTYVVKCYPCTKDSPYCAYASPQPDPEPPKRERSEGAEDDSVLVKKPKLLEDECEIKA